jgi:two-component sensor histidine kinase
MPDRQPRILIIDDDEGFCKLASKHLQRARFDVVCVNTAAEGIREAQGGNYEAVILDHVLPEHDGLTLLSALQTNAGSPPVIYLTGSQESRVAVAALKAGAADYVVKDLHGDFMLLLENSVTNAMFSRAIKIAKEKAETEVREARDQFKALAEERELLLREVNHRVSNSLQLIASLLHFQGDVSKNADVKAALKEANGRVLAVARVHRSLYTSSDVRWVALADYLANLIRDLQDVTAGGGDGDSISFSAAQIQARPDTAVAIGIVATELILNALKHAYPNGRGPVRVRLSATPANVELSVEDDGIGGLHDPEGNTRSGLGQRIISGMTEKLDGKLRYDRKDRGTRAVVTFPIKEEIRVIDRGLNTLNSAA